MGSRKVEVIVARAVTSATQPGFDPAAAASELVELADGSWAVVNAALIRVDHALDERWSRVAADAGDALRIALSMIEHRLVRAA